MSLKDICNFVDNYLGDQDEFIKCSRLNKVDESELMAYCHRVGFKVCWEGRGYLVEID